MSDDPFAPKAPATGDVDSFLSGGGAVTAKFPVIGHSYTGIVLSKRMEQQRDYDDPSILKTWKDGNPMMHAVVILHTDAVGTFDRDGNPEEVPEDDGSRALYVKGQLQKAIREAVRKSGAPTLELFGKLTVTHTGLGKQDNPRYNPPKLFSASFVPASKVAKNDPLLIAALESQNEDEDPFSV